MDEEIDKYVKVFKALANPHRLFIFLKSIENMSPGKEIQHDETSCQREIAEKMGIVPSTMSHHIKELANAGLLNIERDGQRVSVSLNETGIEQLREFLQKMTDR